MKNWIIAYDQHTDDFQIYDESFLHLDRKGLHKISRDDITIFIRKEDKEPVFLEVKNAYSKLGNLDNQEKNDIIRRVKPLMKAYA